MSEGPLTRGLNLWRSHPRWFMHRVLADDCAGRGGCYGRDCGCCLGREVSPARKLGAGHCTIECGCCMKARGFTLTPEQKKGMTRVFRISRDYQDPYYHRIVMASIWGLWKGSQDSPFDLIDESGRVDHDLIPCTGLAYVGSRSRLPVRRR
ncbi:unnamed protein product [Penicillium salamii]|nr:unnamed protein product [Penicillium salamii]CAG8251529.1 unnamed protein product [Penicillium salamii]